MSTVETRKSCCICGKIFCCVECRKRHETRKHSLRELNCPLCSSENLSLKPGLDDGFLCHLAFHHFPLICRLCGQVFKHVSDLKNFDTCTWWKFRSKHSLSPSVLESSSSWVTCTKLSAIKNSIDSSGGTHFSTLKSPLQFLVNGVTSTPMNSSTIPNFKIKTIELKTPGEPKYVLRTPDTGDSGVSDYQTCSTGTTLYTSSCDSTTPSLPEPEMNKSEAMELTEVAGRGILPDPESSSTSSSSSGTLEPSSDPEPPPPRPIKQVRFDETNVEEFFDAWEGPADQDKENLNVKTCTTSRLTLTITLEHRTEKPHDFKRFLEAGIKNIQEKINSLDDMAPMNLSILSTSSKRISIASSETYVSATKVECVSASPARKPSGFFSSIAGTVKNAIKSIANGINASKSVAGPFSNQSNTTSSKLTFFSEHNHGEEGEASRPNKRPREKAIVASSTMLDEHVQDLRSRQMDSTSPIPKRQRLVFKPRTPRSRKPLSRMRLNHTYAPSSSQETQVFHQGTLSIGNRILPLPCRAHQFTQTE